MMIKAFHVIGALAVGTVLLAGQRHLGLPDWMGLPICALVMLYILAICWP
jgi:hypothetical protein